MRYGIAMLVGFGLCLGATQAQAKSCSSFAVVKAFDADASTVQVSHEKGRVTKYFPKPAGTPRDSSKIPKKCNSKITKQSDFKVKSSGGRMTMTQVRTNFRGDMLNDAEDPNWLPTKLKELIASNATVVLVIRPGMGKDAPLGITTVYLPITEGELAEIKKLDDEAEDI